MLRKHHYQATEDPEIDLEIREPLQNRYARIENVVDLTNYSKIVLRADVEKILPLAVLPGGARVNREVDQHLLPRRRADRVPHCVSVVDPGRQSQGQC